METLSFGGLDTVVKIVPDRNIFGSALIRTRIAYAGMRFSAISATRTFKTLSFPGADSPVANQAFQLYRARSVPAFGVTAAKSAFVRRYVSLLYFYAIHKDLCRISSSSKIKVKKWLKKWSGHDRTEAKREKKWMDLYSSKLDYSTQNPNKRR